MQKMGKKNDAQVLFKVQVSFSIFFLNLWTFLIVLIHVKEFHLFQYYDFILPGVPEAFKPNTRFDIIQWTYFTDSHIYFDDDFTNIRPLKGIILHN